MEVEGIKIYITMKTNYVILRIGLLPDVRIKFTSIFVNLEDK